MYGFALRSGNCLPKALIKAGPARAIFCIFAHIPNKIDIKIDFGANRTEISPF